MPGGRDKRTAKTRNLSIAARFPPPPCTAILDHDLKICLQETPPTPLENWKKYEDKWVKEVRQRLRDNGVSEEEINRRDQVATALATALAAAIVAITLAAGVYYLYSAWVGPGNEEND